MAGAARAGSLSWTGRGYCFAAGATQRSPLGRPSDASADGIWQYGRAIAPLRCRRHHSSRKFVLRECWCNRKPERHGQRRYFFRNSYGGYGLVRLAGSIGIEQWRRIHWAVRDPTTERQAIREKGRVVDQAPVRDEPLGERWLYTMRGRERPFRW